MHGPHVEDRACEPLTTHAKAERALEATSPIAARYFWVQLFVRPQGLYLFGLERVPEETPTKRRADARLRAWLTQHWFK